MRLEIESKLAFSSHSSAPTFLPASPPNTQAGDALTDFHPAITENSPLYGSHHLHPDDEQEYCPSASSLECDAKRSARFDDTGNVRTKRSTNSTEAAMMRESVKALDWIDMPRARTSVHNATQALIAVMRHADIDTAFADAILQKLGDKGMTLRQLTREGLIGDMSQLLDQAALLHYNVMHSTPRTTGAPSLPAGGEVANVRTSFAAALEREALMHSMFNARDLSATERATVVHFRGNALVNAVGKNAADLANDPTLLSNPGFARLTQDERGKLVTAWLDAHGLDTQYAFGTVENAMATVLKTTALKGGALGKPYASEKELATRFMRAVNSWSDNGGSMLDPRVLFGLTLARSQGIDIAGATPAEKLTDLQHYINDAFAEARTAPHFNFRQTALDFLKANTGFSEAQLTIGSDQSYLAFFLAKVNPGFFDTASMRIGNYPSMEPRALMRDAEEAFNKAVPTSEWVLAHARMELRRAHQPITDEAIKDKAAEIAKEYLARVEPDTTSLLHWAENMPIVAIFVGLGEGIAEGDVSKIVSAIPVVGNVYNIGAGIIDHDGQRIANAALTLIPVVGSVYNVSDMSPEKRATAVHFLGNALVNAAGKKASDLANDRTLLENPGFARLPQAQRIELVTEWLDEHGLDTQYPFGTIENSMATVLKVSAEKGGGTTALYASEKDLVTRFMRAATNWSNKRGDSIVDPRVLFGLNLARTQGIDLKGANTAEKLESLRQYVRDVFAELRTPPHFDRRQAALDILKNKTGLSEMQLTAGGDKSSVERFLSKVNAGFYEYSTIKINGGPLLEPHALMVEAEKAFNDALRTHEWTLAHARMELRRAHHPISEKAVKAKAANIAKQYATALERETAGLTHWLENMPAIGSLMALGHGMMERDAGKFIGTVPLIGNLYNMVAGAIAHDGERVLNAGLTLIPVVGSIYNIEEGVRTGDPARATGGAISLGIDILTLGTAHVIASRSIAARGVADGERFSTAEIPPTLQRQASHTVGALEQLNIRDLELAITPDERALPAENTASKPAALVAAIRRAEAYAKLRKDAMAPAGALKRNARGMLERDDYHVLFRGDLRSPTDIIGTNGFGKSHIFVNERLTDFPPLIASAQYDGALRYISREARYEHQYYYVYALDSAERKAASLNENALHNPRGMEHLVDAEPGIFDDPAEGVDGYYMSAYDLDEVHVRGGFAPDKIYLLDTDDPMWMAKLSDYYSGQPNVLGLPLSEIETVPTVASR